MAAAGKTKLEADFDAWILRCVLSRDWCSLNIDGSLISRGNYALTVSSWAKFHSLRPLH